MIDSFDFLPRFFRGEFQGEALPLAYLAPEEWEGAYANPDYYLPRHELLSLSAALPHLAPLLRNREVIFDLGPGTPDAVVSKSLPVIDLCAAAAHYKSIDINRDFADTAAEIVARRYQDIATYAESADAFLQPPTTFGMPALFLLMGLTGANLPRVQGVPGIFHWMHSLLSANPSGLVLTSFDTNLDVALLERGYAGVPIGRGWLATVESRIGWTGFRAVDFRAFNRWDDTGGQIVVCIQATRDVSLDFGSDLVHVARGRIYNIGVSIKLPDHSFRGYVELIGGEVIDAFRHPESAVVIYLIGRATMSGQSSLPFIDRVVGEAVRA